MDEEDAGAGRLCVVLSKVTAQSGDAATATVVGAAHRRQWQPGRILVALCREVTPHRERHAAPRRPDELAAEADGPSRHKKLQPASWKSDRPARARC